MKIKSLLYSTGLLGMWYILVAYAANPPVGYTGGAGEPTCSTGGGCHFSGTYAGAVTLTGISGTVNPGQVYPITVTAASTAVKGGFQLMCLDGSNAKCGNISTASGVGVASSGGKQYARQTSAKTYSNGMVSWSFNWTAPASLTNNNITFYYVSLAANGNGQTGGDIAFQNTTNTQLGVVTPLNVSITKQDVACNGAATGLAGAAATNGTAPYTYLWSNGSTNAAISNVVAGTYSVTVTSGASSGTATTTINQPTAIVPMANVTGTLSCANPSVLANGSASGGTAPYTYSWSNGLTGSQTTYSSAGTHSLTVTDNANCTKITTFSVTGSSQAPTASIASPGNVCPNGTLTLNALGSSPNMTYSWTGNGIVSGGNTLTPTINMPGTYTLLVTNLTNNCTATANTTVNQGIPPTISMSAAGSLNCAAPATTVSSGNTNANFTYFWSSPNGFTSSTATPTVSNVGTYNVSVTNNACLSTGSIIVSGDFTPPSFSATATTITCTNLTSSLAASSPVAQNNYNWSGPNNFNANGASTTTVNAGSYSVVATGSNGCTASMTVVVNTNTAAPTAISNNPTITCATQTATLQGSSMVESVNYNWSGPNNFTASNNFVTVDRPGSYVVTVTGSNGCKTIATSVVAQDIAIPIVTVNNDTLDCTNLTGKLTATVTGNATFAWSGPNNFSTTTASIQTNTAGTYNVTVTGENGCKALNQGVIYADNSIPLVAVTSGTLSCINNAVALSATSSTNATFTWSGPNNINATTSQITTSTVGIYTVTATTANGCSVVKTTIVDENKVAPILTITPQTLQVCSGSTVSYQATSQGCPSCTYSWTDLNTIVGTNATLTQVVTSTHDYILVVTNPSNGCTAKGVAVANILPNPVGTATTISENCQSCFIVAATGGKAPYTFLWSNGTAGAKICVTETGNYQVKILDTNSCENVVSVQNTAPAPILVTSKTIDATVGQNNGTGTVTVVGGTAPYTYNWINSNTQTVGTSPILGNATEGVYICKIKDAAGCEVAHTVVIKGIVATSEENVQRLFQLYPNPTQNTCTIALNILEEAEVNILNLQGQLLYQATLQSTETTVDVADWSAGTYIVKIKLARGVIFKKLLIVKY